VDEDEVYWRCKKASEELAWPHNTAHVISQLAQCFTNAMVGPRSWIGAIFSRSSNRRYGSGKLIDYPFSPHQEERLQKLQERLHLPFDETCADHQEALRELWFAAFPHVALRGLISEQWKDMGWQGPNPSTDFRYSSEGGRLALLLSGSGFFASFQSSWSTGKKEMNECSFGKMWTYRTEIRSQIDPFFLGAIRGTAVPGAEGELARLKF
ncbi:hypothetical protein U1Q18_001493, partial [Sarracenia purpurea var. burkii]